MTCVCLCTCDIALSLGQLPYEASTWCGRDRKPLHTSGSVEGNISMLVSYLDIVTVVSRPDIIISLL